MKAARPHDDAMVELLREDPAFADEYVTAALEEADQPGGGQALLRALRQVAQAKRDAGGSDPCGIAPRKPFPRTFAEGNFDP